MTDTFKYRILLVDSDEGLLKTTADLLSGEGYIVSTARDGFEALAALRNGIPEIIVSDLTMPNMSGFELLAVIRKRFPSVGVIAWSGEFSPLSSPEGLLADRFLHKDDSIIFEVLEAIRELLTQLPVRSQHAKLDTAPAWLPRSAKGYVVVTCPMCLRSSSLSTPQLEPGVAQDHTCVHCGAAVRFRIDKNLSTDAATPAPFSSLEESRERIKRTKESITESRRIIDAGEHGLKR